MDAFCDGSEGAFRVRLFADFVVESDESFGAGSDGHECEGKMNTSLCPSRIESSFKICVREPVMALTAVELSARCIFMSYRVAQKDQISTWG